ncbi:hypothetical protein NEF87_001337 [Candidatus Lokiarchaeum ossiferum]|uniref:Uncharacterized protein n=1 Tax=Candidatus Lokiarchaeum ossiferum TaxID=2951803 RepID=A0ABY6HRN3_9ARCH|nr:hypothetical protein NEF87_001337 [Candidatus Lokiarchaeum sp. B-35]
MNKDMQYYGQSFPTNIPQEFVPCIISTDQHNHSSPALSADHKECYWSMITFPLGETPQKIYFSRFENGKWNPAQLASFSSDFVDGGPVFSFDNQHLYFYSKRPLDSTSEANTLRVWQVDRTEDGWSVPYLTFGDKFAHIFTSTPSISKSGTFYFTSILDGVKNNMGIYRIRQSKGIFSSPELLPPQINSSHHDWIPFISPDESYLIFSSDRPGSIGDFDLFISFHTEDDQWTKPMNLGPTINSKGSERFPGLTPDGKAFFFVRESEIYWIDSNFIKKLKDDAI